MHTVNTPTSIIIQYAVSNNASSCVGYRQPELHFLTVHQCRGYGELCQKNEAPTSYKDVIRNKSAKNVGPKNYIMINGGDSLTKALLLQFKCHISLGMYIFLTT